MDANYGKSCLESQWVARNLTSDEHKVAAKIKRPYESLSPLWLSDSNFRVKNGHPKLWYTSMPLFEGAVTMFVQRACAIKVSGGVKIFAECFTGIAAR